MINLRRMSWVMDVARIGENRIAYIVLVGWSEGK
jgi:hypothetical protein